jgi:protein-S-isoprenylcysteine O-methyltransferase Ste14
MERGRAALGIKVIMDHGRVLVTIQFVLLGMIVFAFLLLPISAPLVMQAFGALLILDGGLLFALAAYEHWARNRNLPNIVPAPKDSAHLVTGGVYKFIRHPIYTGVIAGAFGIALIHGHVILFMLAGALLMLFWFKSRYEDDLLIAAYPEYADYKQRVGRFFPKLSL